MVGLTRAISMLRDVEYFTTRLSRIDGFGDAGEYLATIIKTKQIALPELPPPAVPDKDEAAVVAAEDEKPPAEEEKPAEEAKAPAEANGS